MTRKKLCTKKRTCYILFWNIIQRIFLSFFQSLRVMMQFYKILFVIMSSTNEEEIIKKLLVKMYTLIEIQFEWRAVYSHHHSVSHTLKLDTSRTSSSRLLTSWFICFLLWICSKVICSFQCESSVNCSIRQKFNWSLSIGQHLLLRPVELCFIW